MSGLKKYKIQIFNLPAGEHEYEFDFKSDFFKNFENSIVDRGQGYIHVKLQKSDTFFNINIRIKGSLELICDRSLDAFDHPVDIETDLIYKFDEEEDSDSSNVRDDIVIIPWNTQSIYLDQLIYEFLSLEVPMKKLHPRFITDKESEIEELVYTSEMEDENEQIDPRWQKLNELRKQDKKKE